MAYIDFGTEVPGAFLIVKGKQNVLIQSDQDWAGVARSIGWRPCKCGASDGTVACKECNISVEAITKNALAWIRSREGMTFDTLDHYLPSSNDQSLPAPPLVTLKARVLDLLANNTPSEILACIASHFLLKAEYLRKHDQGGELLDESIDLESAADRLIDSVDALKPATDNAEPQQEKAPGPEADSGTEEAEADDDEYNQIEEGDK